MICNENIYLEDVQPQQYLRKSKYKIKILSVM